MLTVEIFILLPFIPYTNGLLYNCKYYPYLMKK